MANINVTIRMDEQLKAQADELFSDLGLSLSSAITMFAKQAVREQRIPFEVKRTGTKIQTATDSSVEKLSKRLIEKTGWLMRSWRSDRPFQTTNHRYAPCFDNGNRRFGWFAGRGTFGFGHRRPVPAL